MEQNITAKALKEQMTVTVNDTVYIVNHIFNGTKTITELYEELIRRKLQYS